MKNTKKISEKRFVKPLRIAVFVLLLQIINITAFSQCQPFIKIDGNILIANQTVPTGLTLPVWLNEGQYIACGPTINSVSVIEFTENVPALEYSGVISITGSTAQTVPAGKVWKVESIMKQPIISGGTNSISYVMEGTSTFTVPGCSEYICIEVWGAGGGGQGNQTTNPWCGGGGGGGGSYGQQCFSVTPGASYTVTVGAGGAGGACSLCAGSNGGTTSVGAIISAGGGNGGITGGGNGGTSTAAINVPGFKGLAGITSGYKGGSGGYGANGGAGGIYVSNNGTTGSSPGGGGSGAGGGSTQYTGGAGAPGKVIITW